MGLHIKVYRDGGCDATNDGISRYVDGFTLTNIEGPHEVSPEYPAAKLVVKRININDSQHLRIVPEAVENDWHMFGGNLGFTGDSRFSRACKELLDGDFGGAVKIFDRVE